MPELKLTDDPAEFSVETKHGNVQINAQELASALMAQGVSETVPATAPQMAQAVKQVATPTATIETFSEHGLFALGCRVNLAFDELGKDSAASPTSPPPTESSSDQKA